MSERPYEVLHLDELERVETSSGPELRPVRRRLGFGALGVNCWTAHAVGDRVIEEHREPDGPEELYAVVTGRATFTLGDETIDAPPGTLVSAPPGVLRGAIAAEPETTVLALGAPAGEPYVPLSWEEVYAAEGMRRRGDLDGARRTLRELVEARPDQWQGFYNLACFESLAGETDKALDALRRAVELNAEPVREYAADDEDFDSIRTDPRFEEALA